MEPKVEASVNVLWQNLIALNSSLYRENEERGKQLIQLKKMLQEKIEEMKLLRSKSEDCRKELLEKNYKIARLTSKLETVRQITADFFGDDNNETTSSLVEIDRGAQSTSVSARNNTNQSSNLQRKISNFVPSANHNDTESKSEMHELNNTEETPVVEINSDSNLEYSESGTDDRAIPDENLLVPLRTRSKSLHILQSTEYNCNVCDRKFANTHTLKRHEFIHTGERPFTCVICSRSFTRIDYMKAHMKSHTNEKHSHGGRPNLDDSIFACAMCSQTFKNKWLLISHNNTHRKKGNVELPTCDVCNKQLQSAANVRRHKRAIHNMHT